MLVIVNSYLNEQTDDFESKGAGTNRLGYLALRKKMAAIKYIWSRLLLNGRKRQPKQDFVSFQRPLTYKKYLLLDLSNSVTLNLFEHILV